MEQNYYNTSVNKDPCPHKVQIPAEFKIVM